VALDPEVVQRLVKDGREVLIESGAGLEAHFPDAMYVTAGATIASRSEVLSAVDVLAVVRCPDDAVVTSLRENQVLIGLIDPLNNLPVVSRLASAGVTAVAFELLPRTVSRAQSMDALSSQASAAGYRAGIVAAEAFGRYFPMMITASGTARPAAVIVIGTGVAGLQAIATARRLGAVVTGYDVRADSRGQVESLGAQFLTSSITAGAGEGGYARAMNAEEQAAQQAELAAALVSFDVIITTAKVPGRVPPVLVAASTLAGLKAGSVCIDLAASDRGGNVAGSVDGQQILTDNGVIVIGAGELASDMPTSSSQMYARNVQSMLQSLLTKNDGADVITVDVADEVHAAVVVTHQGEVVSPAVRKALKLDTLVAAAATSGAAAATAAHPKEGISA
jgi:NAD(P) transhydrogenase subunit alpha